jgi:hypothetical protein
MSRIRIHIKPNSRKKRKKKKAGGWGRIGDPACSPVYAFDKISNFCMTKNSLRFKKVKQISYKTNDLSKLVSLHKHRNKQTCLTSIVYFFKFFNKDDSRCKIFVVLSVFIFPGRSISEL